MAASEDYKTIIAEDEALFQKNKDFQAMHTLLLPHKDCNDANVLWRLARASSEHAKSLPPDEKRAGIFEGFEYAKRALELDNNNFACHKWYAILLHVTTRYTGNKSLHENCLTVKEHLLKAVELNPNDALSLYWLGNWSHSRADLNWYDLKISAVVFGSPVTGTYEEALQYFEAAEKAEPGFSNRNYVMWTKTLIALNDIPKAKEIAEMVFNYNAQTMDDKEAVEVITQLKKSELA